jgi:GT2 family glycosyltransferase
MTHNHQDVAIIIPNWNGGDMLTRAVGSAVKQVGQEHVIVVDNGSVDASMGVMAGKYPHVQTVLHDENKGFAGGVNAGIRVALAKQYDYVLLLNNDAALLGDWVANAIAQLNTDRNATKPGIITGKILHPDGTFDTAGDLYSNWLAPYPRGRGETDQGQYDTPQPVAAACAGASLYSCQMFKEIGLFDERFFAYYEDVDISLRAWRAGWKVSYNPSLKTIHDRGVTSGKIKGFTTYHTFKNMPLVWIKSMPPTILVLGIPRFMFLYSMMGLNHILKGNGVSVLKGYLMSIALTPAAFASRFRSKKAVGGNDAIRHLITKGIPPMQKQKLLFWKGKTR